MSTMMYNSVSLQQQQQQQQQQQCQKAPTPQTGTRTDGLSSIERAALQLDELLQNERKRQKRWHSSSSSSTSTNSSSIKQQKSITPSRSSDIVKSWLVNSTSISGTASLADVKLATHTLLNPTQQNNYGNASIDDDNDETLRREIKSLLLLSQQRRPRPLTPLQRKRSGGDSSRSSSVGSDTSTSSSHSHQGYNNYPIHMSRRSTPMEEEKEEAKNDHDLPTNSCASTFVDDDDDVMRSPKKAVPLRASSIEIGFWLISLTVNLLSKDKRIVEALTLCSQAIAILNHHIRLQQSNPTTTKSTRTETKSSSTSSSLQPLLRRLQYAQSQMATKSAESVQDSVKQMRLSTPKRESLRKDREMKAMLMNLMLREQQVSIKRRKTGPRPSSSCSCSSTSSFSSPPTNIINSSISATTKTKVPSSDLSLDTIARKIPFSSSPEVSLHASNTTTPSSSSLSYHDDEPKHCTILVRVLYPQLVGYHPIFS